MQPAGLQGAEANPEESRCFQEGDLLIIHTTGNAIHARKEQATFVSLSDACDKPHHEFPKARRGHSMHVCQRRKHLPLLLCPCFRQPMKKMRDSWGK